MTGQPPASGSPDGDWSDKKSDPAKYPRLKRDGPQRARDEDWADSPPPKTNYPRLERDRPGRGFDERPRRKKTMGVAGGVGVAVVIILVLLRIVVAVGRASSSSSSSSSSSNSVNNFALAKSNADIAMENMRNSSDSKELAKTLAEAKRYVATLSVTSGGSSPAAQLQSELTLAGNCLKHYQAADALREQDKAEAAVAEYEQAAQQYTKLGTLWYDYTDTLLDLDKVDEALAVAQRGIKAIPNDSLARLALGCALRLHDEPDEAIKNFAASARENDKQVLAFYFWGRTLDEQGKPAEAEAQYAKAVRLEPKNVGILNVYGLAQFDQEKYDQAIATFKRALAVEPDSPSIHFNCALAYGGKKDYHAAVTAMKTALKIDPANDKYKAQLAYFERKEKDPNAPDPEEEAE